MDLDRLLEEYRRRRAGSRRVERRGPDCLSFAELAETARVGVPSGAEAANHLRRCERCASLVERIRASAGAESESGGPERGRALRGRPGVVGTVVRLAGIAAAAAAAAVLFFVLRAPSPTRVPPSSVTLGEVFEEGIPGGLLEELLTRSFAEAEPSLAPSEEIGDGVVRQVATIRGARFWGYCNPLSAHRPGDACQGRDCEGHPAGGSDPCEDPEAMPTCREGRMTLEMFFPEGLRPDPRRPDSCVLLVLPAAASDLGDSGGSRSRDLARSLASLGVPTVLWCEADVLPHPPDGDGVLPICRQFGYASDSELQEAARRWMMTRGELGVRDLRLDVRFARAQSYVLAATFYEAFLRERLFPKDARVEPWLASLRVCFAGDIGVETDPEGSPDAAADPGCVTAAGIDPRAVALYVGGFPGFGDGPQSGYHRLETDWSLCARERPSFCDGVASDPSSSYAAFAAWAWNQRDRPISYFNAFLPLRNADRYRGLLILDAAATHDPAIPLGANAGLWCPAPATDGEIGGDAATSEPLWNVRIVRRVNRGRGVGYPAGREGERSVTADELLLARAMLHLRYGEPLPGVRLERLDTSDPSRWVAVVRISGEPEGWPFSERFAVHVALSDDRDFRRCDHPIVCSDDGRPCGAGDGCLEPEWDDNKDAEDRFITIPVSPEDVETEGEHRLVTFAPPPEIGMFDHAPLAAVLVQVGFEGPAPAGDPLVDDLLLFTEVAFVNEGLYPAHRCVD
jgi:hypothetical protein